MKIEKGNTERGEKILSAEKTERNTTLLRHLILSFVSVVCVA